MTKQAAASKRSSADDRRPDQAKNVSSMPASGSGTQSGSMARACCRFCLARGWAEGLNASLQAEYGTQTSKHRVEFEMPIRDVDGEDTVSREVVEVGFYRFQRQEVYGYGVGRESINHQDIELPVAVEQ